MITKRLPCYLRSFTLTDTKDKDGDPRRAVVLKFEIEPFTKEHADDCNVKTRLFDSSTGEPHPNIIEGKVAIAVDAMQRVSFYRTSDDQIPIGLTLRNVAIDRGLKYRRSKSTPTLRAVLAVVTDGVPDADALRYLIDGQGLTHFLLFEDEQPDLLETPAQARKRPARLRPGVTEEFTDDGGAPATH